MLAPPALLAVSVGAPAHTAGDRGPRRLSDSPSRHTSEETFLFPVVPGEWLLAAVLTGLITLAATSRRRWRFSRHFPFIKRRHRRRRHRRQHDDGHGQSHDQGQPRKRTLLPESRRLGATPHEQLHDPRYLQQILEVELSQDQDPAPQPAWEGEEPRQARPLD